ncbi:universal stress protein [Bremerella cremea]|uniref:Universal stress protein n=1 Tax=Blastopirellula marina TaxID=124 RepID=A0A2S8FJ06_9BACT|nr:universal stress protein [Blastopirellula marina]RCS45212.1 universal stress protein [Bremerella cremea]
MAEREFTVSWISTSPIVVPFDFSADSREAVDKAIALVGSGEGIYVIHVLGELSPADPGEVWHTVDENTRTQHATQAIRKELADEKYKDVKINITFGDPGEKICQFAEKINAGSIIISSHGRSSIMRVLLGSVADRVVRLADRPVIVLKKPRD